MFETKRDIENFCHVYGLGIGEFPSKKWITIAENLQISEPRWDMMIPTDEYNKLVVDFVGSLINEIKNKTKDKLWYYANIIPIEKYVLDSFQSVCFSNGDEKSPYQYKRTAVGRLVSENNLNLFLLSQERRELTLVSRFTNGNIISADIVALEPRVMLAIQNPGVLENCADVYSKIAQVSKLDVDRNVIKLCLLKILNGAYIGGISDGTNLSPQQAQKLREFVFGLFHYREKVSELKAQQTEFGRIFNYFGRPHEVPPEQESLLFTYFMQSTSAEVCLVRFYKIAKLIEKNGLNKAIIPIAMIYDSIIFDVKDGFEQSLKDIVEETKKIKIGNGIFDFPMSYNLWKKEE